VVAWPVADADIARRKRETADARQRKEFTEAPVLGDAERPDRGTEASVGRSPFLRIAVPHDVSLILAREPARALRWRQANRAAFESALAAGYTVGGFVADAKADRGYYLLTQSRS
jgi:predicted GNAT superfamily acetyltransferase